MDCLPTVHKFRLRCWPQQATGKYLCKLQKAIQSWKYCSISPICGVRQNAFTGLTPLTERLSPSKVCPIHMKFLADPHPQRRPGSSFPAVKPLPHSARPNVRLFDNRFWCSLSPIHLRSVSFCLRSKVVFDSVCGLEPLLSHAMCRSNTHLCCTSSDPSSLSLVVVHPCFGLVSSGKWPNPLRNPLESEISIPTALPRLGKPAMPSSLSYCTSSRVRTNSDELPKKPNNGASKMPVCPAEESDLLFIQPTDTNWHGDLYDLIIYIYIFNNVGISTQHPKFGETNHVLCRLIKSRTTLENVIFVRHIPMFDGSYLLFCESSFDSSTGGSFMRKFENGHRIHGHGRESKSPKKSQMYHLLPSSRTPSRFAAENMSSHGHGVSVYPAMARDTAEGPSLRRSGLLFASLAAWRCQSAELRSGRCGSAGMVVFVVNPITKPNITINGCWPSPTLKFGIGSTTWIKFCLERPVSNICFTYIPCRLGRRVVSEWDDPAEFTGIGMIRHVWSQINELL